MQEFWVSGGFPMLDIKFTAFARYPPRPDTFHDGGLVGLHLHELPNLTKAYCYVLGWWIFYFIHPSDSQACFLGLSASCFFGFKGYTTGMLASAQTSLSSIPTPFSSWVWIYCLTYVLRLYSGAGQSLLDALGYALKTDINYPGRVSYWKALNKALWDPNLRI